MIHPIYGRSRLECNSRSHLTNLLLHLSDGAIQVTSDSLLLVSAQQEESFTEITVDTALDRNVVTSVHEMVASADRWVFSAQVLLQAAKEVDVFSVHEGNEDTECALQTGPEDYLLATRNERRLLHRHGNILDEVVKLQCETVRCAAEICLLVGEE